MESRIITPGPYRATKLWNEVTKYFRAGMPLRKHRQHFKTYGNCFTASEAIDWLHHLLRNNNNFGSEVTRQQTIQLLRKFLKNHVIEDLKGRWGSEDLEDNSNLYRFPSTSPIKTIPNRHPLWKRSSLENVFKEREMVFKMPNLSKRTPKRRGSLESKVEQENEDRTEDKGNKDILPKELSKKDIEDIWGSITLIHLQKILALPSLEEVLNPAQIKPSHIMYNMTHTSKHGVVVLQDKTDDLPHWVLSAMKCLANWPRNNDLSQPTYVGFERDVFRTVADYFLNLSEPLLTFEYYELFVNILVVCGYITVPNKPNRICRPQRKITGPQPSKTQHLNDINLFKSTECLLLSLLRKVPNEEEEEDVDPSFGEISRENKDYVLRDGCAKKMQLYNSRCRKSSTSVLVGGSCQNLSVSRNEADIPFKVRVRSCSVEGITDTVYSELCDYEHKIPQTKEQSPMCYTYEKKLVHSDSKAESVLALCTDDSEQKLYCKTFDRDCSHIKPSHEKLSRSKSIGDCLGTCSRINAPVAEITIKPSQTAQCRMQKRLSSLSECDPTEPDFTVTKRLCQSTMELSSCSLPPSSLLPTSSQHCSGTQSLLQPHLERVAIEALQLCCLLLPPPNRRKLQLLMRMISRMSQNVDMPRLHDAMGTRSLMIQTFSRCVLCCAEEVDLDELLATRLVSFLMDHHQDVLQVPCYLQTAVQDHIQYLQRTHAFQPKTLPVADASALKDLTDGKLEAIMKAPFVTISASLRPTFASAWITSKVSSVLACESSQETDPLVGKLISTVEAAPFAMAHTRELQMFVSQVCKGNPDLLKLSGSPPLHVKLSLSWWLNLSSLRKGRPFAIPFRITTGSGEQLRLLAELAYLHLRCSSPSMPQLFQKEYPEIYRSRFPTTESEAKLFGDKPTIKQPMFVLKKPKFKSLRY
ncbi:DEP domain-containing protein 1A [Rhinophrynus dorsalis]